MAGRIPQSFINDLLARIDIVDVIDTRVPLKKAGKDYQACCPFHDEKTPSFTVSPDKQFYYCFGCQASGTALTFLLEHERLDFVEAVEQLAASVGLEVPREGGGRPDDREHREPMYNALLAAERYYRQQLRQSDDAIRYLKGRGVTGITAKDYGIGFAPVGWQNTETALDGFPQKLLLDVGLLTKNDTGRTYDRFRNRVMFPIRDLRGRVIGFGGRVMGKDEGPKYLNSPETELFKKGEELYGLFEARTNNRQLGRIVVVEGYMDVVGLAQAGIGYAVATLGTSVGAPHFRKIFRYTDEAICCFDGDRAGRQAAWRALEAALGEISDGKQLKFVFLPEGEDPDSLVAKGGPGAFVQHMDQATPAVDYLFSQLTQGLNTDSLDDQAKLAGLATPYLEKIRPGLLQDFVRARLAALTGGLSAAAMPEQPLNPRPAPPAPAYKLDSRISERLLTTLLKQPRLVDELRDQERAELQASDGLGLLGAVLGYLIENGGAGIEELLAAWADEPSYGELLRLAERPAVMDRGALAAEFLEGIGRLLAQSRKSRQKAALEAMKADPSQENFLRFLSQTDQAKDGRSD